MGRGVIVFSARIVIFVVESVMTGSAIGQSLLGSGKGVGQSGPFTVGNRPCDCCSGDYRILCEFGGQGQRKKGGFRMSGGLSAYNLDFYSGFIYEMIGIPPVAGRQVPSDAECCGAGDCGTHP